MRYTILLLDYYVSFWAHVKSLSCRIASRRKYSGRCPWLLSDGSVLDEEWCRWWQQLSPNTRLRCRQGGAQMTICIYRPNSSQNDELLSRMIAESRRRNENRYGDNVSVYRHWLRAVTDKWRVVAWWCNGQAAGLATLRSRAPDPAVLLSDNDLGQVANTHAPLSPSSRPLYIEWSDVTESMVTTRSPFCGYNLA